jgi:hypothetical protein
MPKKRNLEFLKVIAALVLILVIASFSVLAIIQHFSVEGFTPINIIRVEGTTILIGNNCTAITADTSPERALSIELGLERKIENRPNSHDTIVNIMKAFNITLEGVQITNFDGNYYYSDMILSFKDKVLRIETLPSDAIAIALRTNSSIYINSTLLQKEGENICL